MVQNLNVTVEKINGREKITILTLRKMKERGEKVVILSIYDYPHAILADKAGLDIIIVGDMPFMSYQASDELAVIRPYRFKPSKTS